jgi:hypothetical protein
VLSYDLSCHAVVLVDRAFFVYAAFKFLGETL